MIGYVILHYQNYDITVDCIDNLLRISTNSPIVIVDNDSPNGSGTLLSQKYKDNTLIRVIKTNNNCGFAKGNNVGFAFIKDKYNPNIIVVMNNDVMITTTDFEPNITQFITNKNIDVCGPDIITPTGKHQNPLLSSRVSTRKLIVQMLADELRMLLLRCGIFEERIMTFYNQSSASHHKTTITQTPTTNAILHGACIAYGPHYIKHENIAFLPITFLYGEEMILADYLKYKGYTSAVCNEAKVEHLGGVSTAINLNSKDKLIFKTRQMNHSLCALLWQRMKYYFGAIN